jgi:hypothetical protein
MKGFSRSTSVIVHRKYLGFLREKHKKQRIQFSDAGKINRYIFNQE